MEPILQPDSQGERERIFSIDKKNDPPSNRRSAKKIGSSLILMALIVIPLILSFVLSHSDKAKIGVKSDVKPTADQDFVVDAIQLQQITIEAAAAQISSENKVVVGRLGFNEDRLTPVFTAYAGRVVQINATKGDLIKAGSPLLTLESSDLVSAQNDLISAQTDVSKAQLAVEIAAKNSQRAHRLYEQEAVAAKDLQQAENDSRLAADELNRARAAQKVIESKLSLLGKNPDEIRQKNNSGFLARTLDLVAPITGTIVDRKVGAGQFIKPDSSDPLFLIADLRTLWVTGDIYESDVAKIQPGMPVEITTESYPDRHFAARISSVNPVVDSATRTIHFKCLVDNPDGILKPDMFVKVNLKIDSGTSMAVVPSEAVISEGPDSFVFVEVSPSHFRKRKIRIGGEEKKLIAVESGLQRGERIVTQGALLLNELTKTQE